MQKNLNNFIAVKSLLPSPSQLKRMRSGNKISRVFRHIFEHRHIKKFLGTNMLGVIALASLTPNINAYDPQTESSLNGAQISLQTQNSVQYPVKKISITQGYNLIHSGVDFDGVTGDHIYPIKKGIVISTDYSRFSYGNHVVIDHGGGITSLYAHLSKINVNKGDLVNIDTIIGEMGATGRAFGDHLHFEVYENGQRTNPIAILQ